MSKIGRMPVNLNGASVIVSGQVVQYKGPKGSGSYTVAHYFTPIVEGNTLFLRLKDEALKGTREINRIWGLERALLVNKVAGAVVLFEKKLKINGLGFKATVALPSAIIDLEKKGERVIRIGDQTVTQPKKGLLLELGYSHYYYFLFPDIIDIEVDKSGQTIIVKSIDAAIAGTYASKIKDLRRTEPYKGTGIRGESEVVRRKVGKKTG